MKPVRKAVFPVAGLGTRFLPATKAIPKEMLTVVDRPLIQYAVEEAREAGIEQMIFVTGRGKSALEDHFDIAYELEAVMTGRGKSLDALAGTRFPPGAIVSVRQQEPLGLGHAVWCARDIVGDEPFAVLLPDDLMVGEPGCLAQMVAAYERAGGNIVCAQEVPRERTASYGIVTPGATRRPADRGQGPGRKAEAGGRALHAGRGRPLHPPARDHADARRARQRRRRRDPAHRRHGRLDRQAELPRPRPSTASATIAAIPRASSSPISRSRSAATISRPISAPGSRRGNEPARSSSSATGRRGC